MLRLVLLLTAAMAVTGCMSGFDPARGTERPATNTPERFLFEENGALREPGSGTSCLSPLIDPRDGTTIRMTRSSAAGWGDYQVADGRYGVGDRELLRIDCNSGEPLGVVRR